MNTKTMLIAVLALALLSGAALAADEGCIKCHQSDDMSPRGRAPADLIAAGVHATANVGCSDCHGGVPDTDDFLKAHSKKAGFRGKPGPGEVPALCARCHDDPDEMKARGAERLPTGQGAAFAKSVHGGIVPVKGFEEPSCISCHGVHRILPPSDPESKTNPANVPETCARCHSDLSYMRAFTSARVRTDQLTEYLTSTHGKRLAEGDTKVAVCSSCHGTHDILPASNTNSRVYPANVEETCGKCHADATRMGDYVIPAHGGGTRPLPTNQLALYRESVHWRALHENGDLSAPTCNDCHGNHGATPPEIRAVANVCSQCHSRPAELYKESKLKDKITEAGYPACATCHGHHRIPRPDDDFLLAISDGKTLSGWVPDEETAVLLRTYHSEITGFERTMDEVRRRVEEAENFGMDLTRARLKLTEAKDKLIQSRVSVHAFSKEALSAVVHGNEDEEGGLELAEQVSKLADQALEERTFRRQGLVVALLIIVGLMVGLVLKIRQMEARRE